MRPFPLTNRRLTLPAIVTLVLLAALAALLAGASGASAQDSVPDTPDRPTGTAVFIGGVDLEWNDVPGADSYDVQLFRNGQWIDLPGDGIEIAFYGAGAIISELNHGGSSYWFQVRAKNAHGSSDWSAFFNMNTTSEYRLGRQARPDNVPASGAPVINGTAQVGETLTADTTSIEDGNGLDRVEFRLQWVSNDGSADTDIAGATDSTYTLAANDEGKTIKVRVAFTDRGGYAESLTAMGTDQVASSAQANPAPTPEPAQNSPATGAPTITGTAQVGQTLTADTSGISDTEGLADVSYSYQWVSNDGTSDTDITGATDSTYTLVADDEGKTIKVRVSFTDDAAKEETLTSDATAAVAARANSPATGVPTIGGTVQVGETLTADTTGIADSDGLSGATFSYQWISNDGNSDTDIVGATSSTYTLVSADEGKTIKVTVSFTDEEGFEESLTSAATATVAGPNSPATGAPAITGTAQVGETLTADTSGIADADGLANVSYSYQWVANDGTSDSDITGATDSTYTLVAADERKTIKVQVTFTDDAANEETLASAATVAIAAMSSPNAGAPTIKGTAKVGETLTVDTTGMAQGLVRATFSYQWISNDGSADTNIPNATNSAYTLVASDEGRTIKVLVSFTNDSGNEETLTSAATAPVAAQAQTNSEAVSYITVVVTEDTSDPNNVISNFTITWSDADDCSANYNAYLNIAPGTQPGHETPGFQLHVGSAAFDSVQIAKGLAGIQGSLRSNVELYCGAEESGRLVSMVDVPLAGKRPMPSTYSSEPPLSALSVSHGTLTPTFNSYTTSYSVPDVANDVTRITIAATPKEGSAVDLFETSGDGVFAIVAYGGGPWAPPSGLSADCNRGYSDRNGPLVELTDADPNTPGFQVDLYDGENHVHVRVYPTAYCDLGTGYNLAITRAQGSVSLVRPNRAAVGLPYIGPAYIRGPCVGCTMDADVSNISDRDGMGNATLSYQWLADDAEMTGETGSSYTVTSVELGKTLKVRVTFTDDRGTEESVTSNATKVVKLPNIEPTGKPVILGTLEVGQTLTADVSGISDPNGMTNATFSYQWGNFHGPVRDGEEYTLVDRDEGRCGCWLIVTYTDDAGHAERVHGESIGVVAPSSNSPATGAPTITGTVQVGETLTMDTSGVADADGLANVSYSFQWVSNDGTSDTDITGATDSTYTLAAADEGNTIKVRVSFTDDADNEEALTSAATAAVTAAEPDEPPARPQGLTGTVAYDAVSLTWDDPGDATITGYQILRRDRALHGNGDFQVHVDDTGSAAAYVDRDVSPEGSYVYRIKARNAAGLSGRSGHFRADTPSAPSQNSPATGAPNIGGTARVGETLSADVSGIADSDGLSGATFSYQWVSNDGTTDTDITGATDSTYTLAASDEGSAIKVRVTFTDDAGYAETLSSAATAAVAAQNSPAIEGVVRVGETLTVDTSGIADLDGLSGVTFSYQWVSNDGTTDTDIAGATGSTYTLTASDEGKIIKVRVTFTLTSAATEEVEADGN